MMETFDTDHLRKSFFNGAQESFLIFDKDLNFLDVNDSLLRALRLKKDQIIGKHISEISPGIMESERYKLYQHVIKTGESMVIDEMRPHSSLGNFVSRINLFKVGDGLGVAALDITDLKEAVDELETFVYKSSHDMRAPISSILGLIHLSEMDMQPKDSSNQYLITIKLLAQRLDNILKKLMETTRIQQGKKILHLVDFNELLDDIMKSLQHVEGVKGMTIERSIDLNNHFYNDKSSLISLFQNLIDNAIKYRNEERKNSFLKIKFQDENEGVKITLEDNGIGIAEHMQKDVFNMFSRATQKAMGSGLGLYTVKHCIKKLGGNISFISKENIGTTFSIYIPSEKPLK